MFLRQFNSRRYIYIWIRIQNQDITALFLKYYVVCKPHFKGINHCYKKVYVRNRKVGLPRDTELIIFYDYSMKMNPFFGSLKSCSSHPLYLEKFWKVEENFWHFICLRHYFVELISEMQFASHLLKKIEYGIIISLFSKKSSPKIKMLSSPFRLWVYRKRKNIWHFDNKLLKNI